MRITNRSNLPQALVRAVENDAYSKGNSDYSTTELSVPSRIVALKKQHEDELEEEVADRIYSLLGKLGHSVLEQSGTANIIEKRLFADIDGFTISGQVDVVDETILEDWKFTSRWVASEGAKPEWIQQASINRWLCHKNDILITGARNIILFRDWSKPQAARDSTYPQSQVQVFPIEMWGLGKTEQYIRDRVQSHENALKTLPECSDEERWAKPAKIAVMVKGRKRAVKLFDVEKWAQEYIQTEGLKNAYLELRPAESIRCLYYCPVSQYCQQWKEIQKKSC